MEAAAVTDRVYTVEEYLDFEDQSPSKHDFFHGQIIDMSGATLDHNSIAVNLIREISQALKGKPCRVFGSDMRLQAHRSTLYTYPDVQIVCQPIEYAGVDKRKTTITNPRVVVEVLSTSTESRDRGEKFQRYVGLPSLEEYVLVAQDLPRVETYHRRDDGTWLFSRTEGMDAALLVRSLDLRIPFAEVYADVEFDPAA